VTLSDLVRIFAAMFGFAAALGCLFILRSFKEPRPQVRKARQVANLSVACLAGAVCWGNLARLGQQITGPVFLSITGTCLALWYVSLMVNAPGWKEHSDEED
jgi:hypothetical protein